VTGVISLSDILNFLVLRPGGDDPSQPGCTDMFSKAVGTVGPWGQVISPEPPANEEVVKCEPPRESTTTAVESSEALSEPRMEESRQLSKSSSADSAVEATEETLAGEEKQEEGERTSCDKERLGEEERERMSLAEIPTH